MAKVVYNGCYGGFSLSDSAVIRIGYLKGLTIYPENMQGRLATTYWLVPPHERTGILADNAFCSASLDERQQSNKRYRELTYSPRDISRHGADLVKAVEELGGDADGHYADLQIREIPDGSRYIINEYDGRETVMLPEEFDWVLAA